MKDIDKIIFISDLHFGVRSNSLEFLDIQKDYYNNFFIPQVKKLAKNNNVAVFCLGDIFESKQTLNIRVLNETLEIFKNILSIVPVVSIIGNHDIFQKNSNEINSIKPLALLNNMTLYENSKILNIKNKKFYLMPWQFTKEKEKECISEALENEVDYLLCHSEINGLKYNKFTKCSHGNDIDEYKGFKKVISGHIHWRQDQDNILYIGNPYHTNKGDSGNKKGIYILDVESGEFSFIENNHSPEYIKLKLDDILEMETESVLKKINNNFVEIEYTANYIKFPFYKLIDNLQGYRSIEYYSVDEGSVVNDIIDEEDDIDLGDYAELKKFSIMELINEYIENLNTIKEFKEKMKEDSKVLFNECMNEYKESL